MTAAELSAARRFLGRRRGVAEDSASRWSRPRDRSPQGQGRRPDHDTSCSRPRSSAWRVVALWHGGGRGHESSGLALHQQLYEVLRVTRVWDTSRDTLYRHRRGDEPGSRRRPGPLGRCPTRRWSRRSASCWPTARSTARAIADLGTTALRLHASPSAAPAPDARARLASARPVGRPHSRRPTTARSHRAGGRDVGHGPDFDPDRRGPGSDLRHGDHTSTECLGIRYPTCDPVRGARAAPSERARLLRCLCRRDRRRPEAAPTTQPVRHR